MRYRDYRSHAFCSEQADGKRICALLVGGLLGRYANTLHVAARSVCGGGAIGAESVVSFRPEMLSSTASKELLLALLCADWYYGNNYFSTMAGSDKKSITPREGLYLTSVDSCVAKERDACSLSGGYYSTNALLRCCLCFRLVGC